LNETYFAIKQYNVQIYNLKGHLFKEIKIPHSTRSGILHLFNENQLVVANDSHFFFYDCETGEMIDKWRSFSQYQVKKYFVDFFFDGNDFYIVALHGQRICKHKIKSK
jgi:hypothetical protein